MYLLLLIVVLSESVNMHTLPLLPYLAQGLAALVRLRSALVTTIAAWVTIVELTTVEEKSNKPCKQIE